MLTKQTSAPELTYVLHYFEVLEGNREAAYNIKSSPLLQKNQLKPYLHYKSDLNR